MKQSIVLGGAAFGVAAALLVGYKLGAKAEAPSPAVTAVTEQSPRRVRIAPELLARIGLRTERAQSVPMIPSLELVGTVDFDGDRVAEIGGRIGGRITRIHVRPGDRVAAGSPIADLESAELGDALSQLHSSRARSIAARAQARRIEQLAQERLATAREREQSLAESRSIAAELAGAQARLAAMGMNPNDASQRTITLRSPIAGWVITRPALLGESVAATDPVARVADLSELWVLLDVFEKDLAHVQMNDRAEIVSETYPGRTFNGTVNHVAATVDRDSRTAQVRIEVDNAGLLLRPGMFVTARLRATHAAAHADGGVRASLMISRVALVQLEGRPAVFVRLADGAFEPRLLELGAQEGERVEVVRGLSAGDEVVTAGAFALKSELQR